MVSQCDGPCAAKLLPWWFDLSLKCDAPLFLSFTFLGSIHLYSLLAWFLQDLVLRWSSCWLDGFRTSCMYSCFHLFHICCSFSCWCSFVCFIAIFYFLFLCVCSVPTWTHLVSRLIPPFHHFWGMSRGCGSFASLCQLSPVWGLELFCLVTCRVLFFVFYDLFVQSAPPCKSGKVELSSDIFSRNVILNKWIWSLHFNAAWATARRAWKIQAWTGIQALTSVMPVQCSTSWAIWPTGSRSFMWVDYKPVDDYKPLDVETASNSSVSSLSSLC